MEHNAARMEASTRDRYFIRLALLLAPSILAVAGFAVCLTFAPTKFGTIDVVFALAGSIGAAVVWYVIFLILEIRDRSDHTSLTQRFDNRLNSFERKLDTSAAKAIRAFERLEPQYVMAAGRFYFVQHPKWQVAAAIEAVAQGRTLEIEAIGINLKAFVEDHLDTIKGREGAKLHIVVPAPDSPNLKLMCKREGRDLSTVKDEIQFTTQNIIAASAQGAQIKWQTDIATITMVRVNNSIFWRPRFVNDDRLTNTFYHEVQRSANRKLFDALQEEFNLLWKDGADPNASGTKK